MALDFPSNPTNGQIYGDYFYDSSTGAWRAQGAPITFPVGVASGGTGATTVAQAQDNLNFPLVPVVPTSVAASAGTVTVSTTGLITCTSVPILDINGVFSTEYSVYVLLLNGSTTGGAQYTATRMRNSGTAAGGDTSVTYRIGQVFSNAAAGPTRQWVTVNNYTTIGSNSSTTGFARAEIINPAQASETLINSQYLYRDGVTNEWGAIGGYVQSTNTYTGISLTVTSFTGTVQIYAYNR